MTKDGKIYGVLAGVHRGNNLFYNKKLLEKNGITVGDKMSFDEFFAACDKLWAPPAARWQAERGLLYANG